MQLWNLAFGACQRRTLEGNLGSITKTYGLVAAIAGSLTLFGAMPALAQAFSPVSLSVPPVMAPTPREVAPVPPPLLADRHVESTELGYEKGIGPAVGRTLTYRRKLYQVTDVIAVGGGPTFSGGSRFVIAPAGGALSVGIKALDPEQLAALPAATTTAGLSLN